MDGVFDWIRHYKNYLARLKKSTYASLYSLPKSGLSLRGKRKEPVMDLAITISFSNCRCLISYLDHFTIHMLNEVSKVHWERTLKATFRKVQISDNLIFSHHDKNSIKYGRWILIFMIYIFQKIGEISNVIR